MKHVNTKSWIYMTQKRKEYLKTQKLYRQVIGWIVVTCIVVIASTFNHYHLEYQRIAKEGIEAINANVHIPKAEAKTIERVHEVTKTIASAETVEQMIRRIAKEENFKWPDYLVKLAHCESRLDPKAVNDRNNKPAHSKDRGLFQINNYWNKNVTDTQAFDPEFSTRWTIEKINEGKQHYWACDRIIRNVK